MIFIVEQNNTFSIIESSIERCYQTYLYIYLFQKYLTLKIWVLNANAIGFSEIGYGKLGPNKEGE